MTTATALDRLHELLGETLDPSSARRIAEFRLDDELEARLAVLFERCNEGMLTEAERAEYASYVDATGRIDLLKSKAMRLLASLPKT